MKKIVSFFISFFVFSTVVLFPFSCFAKEESNTIDTQTKFINELKSTNSPEMYNYIKELEKYSKQKQSKELYVKIYNSPEAQKAAKNKKTVYTPEEYTAEIIKETPLLNLDSKNLAIYSATGIGLIYDFTWIKITYAIASIPNDPNGFAVTAKFEWQKVPVFQGTDLFVIGHDSNSVFKNPNTRFVYYPDKANPQYSRFFDKIPQNYSSQAYDLVSASGINFKLLDASIDNNAYNINPDNWKLSLKGMPKGFLTCFGYGSTNVGTNIYIMYGHQQVVVDLKAELTFNGGTFGYKLWTVSKAYDTKQFTIDYKFGDTIFDPTDD